MSRKILDAKIVYKVLELSVKGFNGVEINEKISDISYPTINRIITGNFASKKYIEYKKFFNKNEDISFENFMVYFWRDFPQPEYWPDEEIVRMTKLSVKKDLVDIYKLFEIKFSFPKFKELWLNDSIKNKFKKAIKNEKNQTEKIKKTKEIEDNKNESVSDLIKKLKDLTGAEEVILKF